MPEHSQEQPSPAEEIFTRWLAQEGVDVEALCREHPEHAPELRKLHDECERVSELMRRAGVGLGAEQGQSFALRLQARYGSGVDPAIALDRAEDREPAPPSSELLKRLADHALKGSRYQLKGELARGGMGAILKVWDEDLRRNLAMKVILGREEPSSAGGTPPVDVRRLARFLEEAQVTGQLDHPGIVPVHELGIDATGQVFFTMKLVKGRDLKTIFDLVFEGKEGWNETRAVGVLLKVCEAMAYAHAKGVVHRDLKPANIMVGNFGEVYVMDWGLARVLGRADQHDLRLREQPAPLTSVRTERREERQEVPDSPLFTMEGDVVGTPAYMPPEQARGEVENLGPHSDVYAIGAMLYHLLARQMPYCPPGARITSRTVLGLVLHGPPASIESLRKGVPAELVAICEKAMARETGDRYGGTKALAEDLRAYVEGRVVSAYETGAWAEARKWVRRNQSFAVALTAAAALLVAGLTTSLVFKGRADERAAALEVANIDLATAKNNAEEQAYIANIMAADASLRSNEVAEARRRLDACGEHLRGWEWRHLYLTSDTSLAVLRGHEQSVRSVAFNHNGSRIVSGGDDETIRVWNTITGEALLVLRGHSFSVRSVAFSPDGSRIVSGGDDETIRVWSALTGEALLVLRGHPGGVLSVAFSPDGARIASGGRDATIRVWSANSGESLLHLLGHGDSVHSVGFSLDASRIVSGAIDTTVRMWDATSGECLLVLGLDISCSTVALDPDGSRIVSGARDKAIRVWDATSGKSLLVLQGHDEALAQVAFSSDGSRLASGAVDKTIRVWDSNRKTRPLVLRGHEAVVTSVAFSLDGSLIVSGGEDKTVRVWNAASGAGQILPYGHEVTARSVAFSPDGSLLAVGGDKTLHLLSANSGEHLFAMRGHDGTVNSIAFSPDGSRIASGAEDETIRVWSAASGDCLLVLRGLDASVESVAFSPDGVRIASGSGWKSVVEKRARFYSPSDFTLRIWDSTKGDLLLALHGHEGAIHSLAFSPDGSHIASGSADKSIRLWRTFNGETQLVLRGHDDAVRSVAFSPDGLRIVSGGRDNTVRLWSATTGEAQLVLTGHENAVNAVAFSPDGSRIVSGASDKTVRLWNAGSGQYLLVLRGSNNSVTSVDFSPDGSRIASGSFQLHLWETSPALLHDQTRQVTSLASARVQYFFERFGLVDDVIQCLQTDRYLNEDARAVALRIARVYGADPEQLNDLSWSVVKRPGEDPKEYQRAARLSETACKIEPENGSFLNTLGVAQYRLGECEKALATLTRSDELGGGREPADVAFLAMANHHLGRVEAARTALARLRELMQDADLAGDEDAQSFLSEVEALIGD